MNVTFDENDFLTLLEKLATEKGASLFEEPRRKALTAYLNENNVVSKVDSAGNLWVEFGDGLWEETVIFDAHIDVVQKGYTAAVKYEKNKIIGMGIADNLTAVAMLALICKMITNKQLALKRPLKILFSVGEEGDGNLKGVRQVVKDNPIPPFMFISFDLSFEEYSLSALGSKRYKIEVESPGGHSWDDYGTPGSIDVLISFFEKLKNEFRKIASENSGNVSFNIGSVKGGEGINSIAKSATATFEFRSVDYQLLEKLDTISNTIINELNIKKHVHINCSLTGERPAADSVQAEKIEPLVMKLLSAVCTNPQSVPRSTNINIPLVAGWPSVCMGLCRSGRFHSEEEYVEIDSLKDGWNLLCRLFGELVVKI